MERLVAALALTVCGCATTFRDARAPAGVERSEWANFYLIGLVGEAEVDVRDHCPTGRAREVWIGEDVLTLGVSLITLGIYTPRKVAITCAAPPTERGARR